MQAPTAAEFKTRFVEFNDVDNSVCDTALANASRRVGASWNTDDAQEGMFLYAAHQLTLDGYGDTTEASDINSGMAGVKSYSSGQFSVDRSGKADATSSQGLSATSYGQRFKELLRLNVPAILVV